MNGGNGPIEYLFQDEKFKEERRQYSKELAATVIKN